MDGIESIVCAKLGDRRQTSLHYLKSEEKSCLLGPGVMMFEVIPRGPYSRATVADIASTPAFAAPT
jgi:hypothetical protein